MITGKNLIGQKLSAKGQKTFTTFNPKFNSANAWIFYEATKAEVDLAARLAWDAFTDFQLVSGNEKAVFLRTIADEIEALGQQLLKVYCQETGLPEGRALGERGRTCFQLRTFADLVEEGSWVGATIDTAIADRQPTPKPDLRKMAVPLGPIAVFGASNFPLAYSTAGGDTASALASGCPVVVKSHPMHAGTGELVASAIGEAVRKTGMPFGVFSNLNSSDKTVGTQLVEHPKIKGVGFTGSISGGRALFDLAARRKEPIPVFAEMGSINPVVILPEALTTKGRQWAKTYAASITLGTGQFCTNPGLILAIKGKGLDPFIKELSSEISQITPSCMLHPQINSKYEENKREVLSEATTSLVTEYAVEVPVNHAKQAIVQVDGAHFIDNPVLHKEVFGPFSMVVSCDDVDQLIAVINGLEGQLTGTLIASNDDANTNPSVIKALENRVGRMIYNGVPTGVEVCPGMHHGGPYPASTDSRFGAVGVHAIQRWVRPISYQNWPNSLLPKALQNENPLGILRMIDTVMTTDPI